MNRHLTLLTLILVIIGLVVSPAMNGARDTLFPTLVCGSRQFGLDGPFCASMEVWIAVAAVLVLVLAAVGLPFLKRWLRQRGGRGS